MPRRPLHSIPTFVLLLALLALVGAGAQVAVRMPGGPSAWGANTYGKLGDGTKDQRNSPVALGSLADVTAVSAGEVHSVVLRRDGSVWTWGRNNAGQLGDGSGGPGGATPERAKPGPVPGLANVVMVSAGAEHTLVLKADGTVWAWGSNSKGQVGDGPSAGLRPAPVQAAGLSDVASISAGAYASVALRRDGSVWTWGSNIMGQGGNGSADFQPHPNATLVAGLGGVVAVAAGDSHTLALKADGTVWAWGSNNKGQVGDGTGTPQRPATMECRRPVQVVGLSDVIGIAAGMRHSLAVRRDGTVWEWGHRGSDDSSMRAPVQVKGMVDAVAVSDGGGYSLALRRDGSLWSWGLNNLGQLGCGTTEFRRDTPAPVKGLTYVVAFAAGPSHCLAARVSSPGQFRPFVPERPGNLRLPGRRP